MYSQEHQNYPYSEEVSVRYVEDPGLLVLPIAYGTNGPVQASVAIQTSKPQVLRVVEFALERVGKAPLLPDAAQAEPDEVMVERCVAPLAVVQDAGGTLIYSLSGRMSFRRLNGDFSPKYPWGQTFDASTPLDVNPTA